MAAPTLKPRTFFPSGNRPEVSYFFEAGFDLFDRIDSGASGRFEWVRSSANPQAAYLTNRSTGGDPTSLLTSVTPMLNVRAMVGGTFTADSADDFVPIGDKSGTGVTNPHTINLVGTIRADAIYNFTGSVTFIGGGGSVSVIDNTGLVIGSASRTTAGSLTLDVYCNVGDATSLSIVVAPNGTAAYSAFAFAQKTVTWPNITDGVNAGPRIITRRDDPASLKRWGSGYGDIDGLGYDTLYVRLFYDDLPADGAVSIIWDQSDTGDDSQSYEGHAEWWIKDTSTGLVNWPNDLRYEENMRLRGTDREGETIDLAGRDPSDGVGSPISSRRMAWVFTEGTWDVGLRYWNKANEYTDYAFSTITVAADARTNYTVHHSDPADYTSIVAAIADIGSVDDVRIRVLDGHIEPEWTAKVNPGGHWWVFHAEGTATLSALTTGSSRGWDISRRNGTTIRGGFEAYPVGLPDSPTPNPNINYLSISRAEFTTLCGSYIGLQDANPAKAFSSMFNTSSFTHAVGEPVSERVRNVLVFNCRSERQDDYFYNNQRSPTGDENIIIRGCDIGDSDNESGIRTTAMVYGLTICNNNFAEESKDDLRVTTSVACDVIGNHFHGPTRHGTSSGPSEDQPYGTKWADNVNNRINTASGLPCIGTTPGGKGLLACNNAFRLSINQEMAGTLGSCDFSSGLDHPYRWSRTLENALFTHNTIHIPAGSPITTNTINVLSNAPFGSSFTIRALSVSDETGGTWGGSIIDDPFGITKVGISGKVNRGVDQYFVATTPFVDAAITAAPPYDIWGNRRTDPTIAEAAIAAPPLPSEIEPEPEDFPARGIRNTRWRLRI